MNGTFSTIFSAILFLLLFSCKHPDYRMIDGNKDASITVNNVSITDLAKNLSRMNGKYVEVSGKFSFNFEDVALYDYGLFSSNKTCFWLDFTDTFSNSDVLQKLNGKKVTVKGRINANSNGHMGYYLATLEDVYYIVQK